MKMMPELLIMNGQKIMCLKVENITRVARFNYLAMPLRKFPEAFGKTAKKSWYPLRFNTAENINYVGHTPTFRTMTSIRCARLRGRSFGRGKRLVRRMKLSTTGEFLEATNRLTCRCCDRRAGLFPHTF